MRAVMRAASAQNSIAFAPRPRVRVFLFAGCAHLVVAIVTAGVRHHGPIAQCRRIVVQGGRGTGVDGEEDRNLGMQWGLWLRNVWSTLVRARSCRCMTCPGMMRVEMSRGTDVEEWLRLETDGGCMWCDVAGLRLGGGVVGWCCVYDMPHESVRFKPLRSLDQIYAQATCLHPILRYRPGTRSVPARSRRGRRRYQLGLGEVGAADEREIFVQRKRGPSRQLDPRRLTRR
eukprot:2453169-Rhodomonas_salina.1